MRGPPRNIGAPRAQLEHDRGPFNGRAEIAGTVTTRLARQCRSHHHRADFHGNNAHGERGCLGTIQLGCLIAGEYEVRVFIAGFQMTSRKISLKVRDRAVLSATLNVGRSESRNGSGRPDGDRTAGAGRVADSRRRHCSLLWPATMAMRRLTYGCSSAPYGMLNGRHERQSHRQHRKSRQAGT